jgi:hypothetical protein
MNALPQALLLDVQGVLVENGVALAITRAHIVVAVAEAGGGEQNRRREWFCRWRVG